MTDRQQDRMLPMQIMGISAGGAIAGIVYAISGPFWFGAIILVLCLPILLWAWRLFNR